MKRIVVCCDGTWNDLDMRYITNVGRLVQCMGKRGKSGGKAIAQSVYYDDGVGASSSGVRRVLEGATGIGIDEQIYNAYRHICINYEQNDEICLFGFSRGAFAVRSIAGMIGKLGLVEAKNLKHLARAMDVYRSKNKTEQSDFKKQHAGHKNVKITILGCWDTVGSLGIPDKIPFFPLDNLVRKRYQFHDTELGKHVERALHAVAIDERRKEFGVTTMNKPKGAPASQKLIQTWFPGDHSCIGGGSWEKRAFSNHSLKWMVEQAANLGVGLGVNFDLLHDVGLADAGVFFSNKVSFIYGRKNRRMEQDQVTWQDIDQSARYRWQELSDYRPPELKRRFKSELEASTDNTIRNPLSQPTSLKKGQSTWLRVHAQHVDNNSRVMAAKGDHFEISVSRLQVWKDADLDPCDIQGWNTDKPPKAKPAYKDGDKVNPGSISKRLRRSVKSKRLVKQADWFELVISVGKDNYQRLSITKPPTEAQPFVIPFQAKSEGELFFAANDVSHPIGLVDKYDDNTGWVWINIKKIS